MIEYPAQLPAPLIDGYALSTTDPTIRTQMVTGRARQRRRFTNVPVFAQCSWLMTAQQAAFFEAWYKRVLIDGSQWFTCRIKTPEAEEGTVNHDCRFVGIYTGPNLSPRNRWIVTATLELRERPLIPDGWELFPDYWFSPDIIDLALNREWPEYIPQPEPPVPEYTLSLDFIANTYFVQEAP